MKIYRMIIWFSVLLMVGEGIILADFDFVPINAQGQVLGDRTQTILAELERQTFPASYPLPKPKETAVTVETDDSQARAELAKPKAEPKSRAEGSEVDRLIGAFNDSASTVIVDGEKNVSGGEMPQVPELINKNKRVLLKRSLKELQKISDDINVSLIEDMP